MSFSVLFSSTSTARLKKTRIRGCRRCGAIAVALLSLGASALGAMEFTEDPATTGVITLTDGDAKVFSYHYGDNLPEKVPAKFIHSSYIHPLYGVDGSVLTDDFTSDHPHHHGIFWGWPIVKTRGITTDSWMPGKPLLRQHFVRWFDKKATSSSAVLSFRNEWLLDEKEEVARELVTIRVSPIQQDARAIDVQIRLEAIGGPLTLQGSQEQKKGYGGFSYRAAPSFKGARILTDDGVKTKDIMMERHKWLDLTDKKNGLAIFVSPDHPDFPPFGFARNSYTGFLNPSWPGTAEVTLEPGKPVILEYRLYIHRADKPAEEIQKAYDAYAAGTPNDQ